SVYVCKFKLEVQHNVVCGFAPAGRDVYSLAVLSLLRSSVGAQPLLLVSAQSSRFRVSLLTERDLCACAPGYKHLAPLERNEFHSCTSKLNPPICFFATDHGQLTTDNLFQSSNNSSQQFRELGTHAL